jgi:DNA invertase Pin-like site-specific DNA recombinase
MGLARAADVRPEDLAGRTWAGYVRESTRGQADRYGPEIQRAEQVRFAERYGLVATGREYLDLVSGKDTLRRSDFARMVADAEAGAFEALLVYDTSRFARNVADAWSYRDRLARAGVALVFCSDGLIAGNVDTYEVEGLKTVADAAYIRRLSRNVGRGYEQKWRLFSDPGGHAPLGFARTGERRLLEPVEGPDLVRVRRAFELYATGAWSDTALADELGLTEAGLTEILTNPLYAGRAIRHKGRPDEEERPARFAAPVDPGLFGRVQLIRERRRTAHPAGGGSHRRRSYPLVRLMRCTDCGSGWHGDANGGNRRVRHSRRPSCSPSATYRAEVHEEQLARVFDGVRLSESDLDQVLAAMRGAVAPAPSRDPGEVDATRAELQSRLASGEIGIEAFSREWRRLDRPAAPQAVPPDELRLRRARKRLADLGSLWRDAAVPDRLREEAAHELFERLDVRGPELVAVHPQANENAWLLGLVALRQERGQHVGMVGARGIAPRPPTFLSRCASPSRRSPASGCGARDGAGAFGCPPGRTRGPGCSSGFSALAGRARIERMA